jgi:hypothetical protein
MNQLSAMKLFREHLTARLVFLIIILLCSFFISSASALAQRCNSPENQTGESSPNPSEKGENSQTAAEITAVPNRPTFSTTAESVQCGVLEIEYGMEAADSHQNINGLIKFGVLKNLELRFANNPFVRDAGAAGGGDSGAGFKYRIISQAGPLPTFSILYTASLPTSTGPSGIAELGHSVDLLFSKDFGKHHIDFNEGVHFLGRSGVGGFDRAYFTTFDYGHALAGKWGGTIEVAGFSRVNADNPATMTILLAATYNVSSRFVLDVGEYTAAYGNLPRVTFFAGLTYSIADLYHRGRPPHRVSKAGLSLN